MCAKVLSFCLHTDVLCKLLPTQALRSSISVVAVLGNEIAGELLGRKSSASLCYLDGGDRWSLVFNTQRFCSKVLWEAGALAFPRENSLTKCFVGRPIARAVLSSKQQVFQVINHGIVENHNPRESSHSTVLFESVDGDFLPSSHYPQWDIQIVLKNFWMLRKLQRRRGRDKFLWF